MYTIPIIEKLGGREAVAEALVPSGLGLVDPARLDLLGQPDPVGADVIALARRFAQAWMRFEAAREIERKRKTYLRKLREVADLHRTLTAEEVADLVPDAPELPPLVPTATQIVTGNTIRKTKAEQDADGVPA